jgi:hypothetical protein
MKHFIWMVLLCSGPVFGQESRLKKFREVKLQMRVDRISVDRLGGFYTMNDCGIEQFDAQGKTQNKYSPKPCQQADLLEAWPLMRIYDYQKTEQQFLVFDHNLDVVDILKIDPAFAVEPQLATPSPDLKSYWILDINNSVKKIDLASNTVSLESECLKNIQGQFIFLREYQSMLFVLDFNSGIYMINKLGQLVSSIDVEGIRYFSFAGEDLYYLQENKLHFYDIFNRDTYSIEVPPGNKFAIATDEKLILIKDGLAEIFEFAPKK